MPPFEFWHTPRDSIAWTFDRAPDVDEEVVLGDRGVYRVTGVRAEPLDPNVVEFTCEFVRKPTFEELRAQLKRSVNVLPPRQG